MNIGLLTSANTQLRQQLDTTELSDAKAGPGAKADIVESAVIPEAKPRPAGNVAPSTGYASMRAALDARIAADVSAGTLADSDGAAVGAMLDDVDNRPGASAVGDRWPRPAGPDGDRGYSAAGNTRLAARAYLATIARGTLVDRMA